MPLYFFHLRDGEDVLLDDDGREFADLQAVAKAALVEARAIIAEEARGGRILLDKYIDVEDASGVVIHRLSFADAVKIVPPNG
jgi:hypothetical protein